MSERTLREEIIFHGTTRFIFKVIIKHTRLSLSLLGTSKHLIFLEYLEEKMTDAKIFE